MISKPLCLAAALILAPLTTWGDDSTSDPEYIPCSDNTMSGIVPFHSEALKTAYTNVMTGGLSEPAVALVAANPEDDAGMRSVAVAERDRSPE
jgi:hypothetical protein